MNRILLGLCIAIPILNSPALAEEANPLSLFMPSSEDHGTVWWQDGYPGKVEGARWHRSIQTGRYLYILDTESLQIPHLGPSGAPQSQLSRCELELEILVNGKHYRYSGADIPTRFVGPRLIEGGRFLQRTDINGLRFADDSGSELNGEFRFENIAWPDRLGFRFLALPGEKPIEPGEASFGRVGGGFGLDGSNRLDIPADECFTPEQFTWEMWCFLPLDFQAGQNSPWLFCINGNEVADGNIGILINRDGVPEARMNLGGGLDNAHRVRADRRHALITGKWNHLAVSYDGSVFRLYLNNQEAGNKSIGKKRTPRPGPMAIGGRQDGSGDGYPFRGVVDEVRLFDRALSFDQIKTLYHHVENGLPHLKPVRHWSFQKDGQALNSKPGDTWESVELKLSLIRGEQKLESRWQLPDDQVMTRPNWQEASMTIDPVNFVKQPYNPVVSIEASGHTNAETCPVTFDPVLNCHRIGLNDIAPTTPPGKENPDNDSLERVRVSLRNPGDQLEVVNLMFERTKFLQRIGSPITGVSAILRDTKGNPSGIPVQLSKNWHHHPMERGPYTGQWFHGISRISLPPNSDIELELTLAYGHWGGLPAASHSQLSLIGWGGNQRWDQSALGSWGESICYDPSQSQAHCTITDVRPLMLLSEEGEKWKWTRNVGGGDFFRVFNPEGEHRPHTAMQATYERYGPCLTEVTYRGRIHKSPIRHRETLSLARSDDLVCGTYRIRMDVEQAMEFSRLVIFQAGADGYHSSREKKFAVGNEDGLIREWQTSWGGDSDRGEATEMIGRIPWVSMHEAAPDTYPGALANRGLVVREWKAVLGGKEVKPWLIERSVGKHESNLSSIVNIVPPPGLTRLEPGDYVEATIQHLVIPARAADYYGSNQDFRINLEKHGNTWQPVFHQAMGNDLKVDQHAGILERLYPDARISGATDGAELTLTGGLGHVPLTFTGLDSHDNYRLIVDGKAFDQSVHGNDFWQADYDSATGSWSRTYNLPATQKSQKIQLQRNPKPTKAP